MTPDWPGPLPTLGNELICSAKFSRPFPISLTECQTLSAVIRAAPAKSPCDPQALHTRARETGVCEQKHADHDPSVNIDAAIFSWPNRTIDYFASWLPEPLCRSLDQHVNPC